jgi:hypothetical protein
VKASAGTVIWLLMYVAMLAAVIGGMLHVRGVAMEMYGSPEAQAQWNAWRDDAQKMAAEPSVVQRRAPKSAQPPALVLMRDHFAACLAIAVVLSSVLFGTFMILVRGAMSSRHAPRAAGLR